MLDFFPRVGFFWLCKRFKNKVLGPPSEFLGVFGYLIENQYKLEHLKFVSVYDNSHFKTSGKQLGK
jgi:hypothetical protein